MSPPPKGSLDPNAALIDQLAAGLRSTSALIQGLLQEIRSNSITVASVETQLKTMQRNVASLTKTLQEGAGGKESVMTRIALVEKENQEMRKDFGGLAEEMDKLKAARKTETAAEKTSKAQIKVGRFQLVGAIIPAMLAFLVAIITLIINWPD